MGNAPGDGSATLENGRARHGVAKDRFSTGVERDGTLAG
jgi:hypothetical protein